jgi:heat shock protein HslJ
MVLITTSLGVMIANADDTGNGTLGASGVGYDTSYWYPTTGRITYSQGDARGTFVHFSIDENTGTISDYTVKLTFYPTDWYSPLSSIRSNPDDGITSDAITYQNKTIFTSIRINGFEPVATPNEFADYLIFQGKNTFMRFSDVEGGSLYYASSDNPTSITFEVPAGFEVSQLSDDMYYILPVEVETLGEDTKVVPSDSPGELVGEWSLVSYGNATNPTLALQDVDAFIQFNIDGTFGGNVGCNSFGGNYTVSSGIISFGSVVSTEIYCDKTMDQEQGVLSVFSQPDLKVQLNNENLTITNGMSVINLRKESIDIIKPSSDPVLSPWQTIWIKSDNTTTSINSYNGTVTIDGQTVQIELSPYGYLDVYTWVEYPAPPVVNDFWYDDLNITREQMIIEEAKSNGIISAEGWVTNDASMAPSAAEGSSAWDEVKLANTASNNYYTYDDPTFEMTFNTIDNNGVDVIVNSEIPTGRIIIINVDKEVIQNTPVEELLVSIDDSKISAVSTLEELMEKVENKDMDGAYFALSGERLITVFVYISHFSTHTISIQSLASGIPAVSNVVLPIILSVLFICLVIGGIIMRKRKQQDEF